MTFIDTSKLAVIERKPGWRGRFFDSPSMSFVHYEIDAGAAIHSHSHGQEEVWNVISGEFEITVGGVTQTAGPGHVAIVPANTEHHVKALTGGRVIIVDYPLRAIPG